jgi:2'-5' RNA ligase
VVHGLTGGEKTRPHAARIFLGVYIAEDLRPAASELQSQLRQAGVRVTWVAPHNLHFTLQFIGDTPTEIIPRLVQTAGEAAESVSAFTVNVAGIGAFPSPLRARTLWLGCDRGAAEFGHLEEARPFAAHCTLGRVRERPSGKLIARIEQLADAVVGEMSCTSFSLIKSTLTGSGPVYEVLEDFRLRG